MLPADVRTTAHALQNVINDGYQLSVQRDLASEDRRCQKVDKQHIYK